MLEWGTLERFPGRKVRGVSLGHTQSRFLLSPSLQVPAVWGKGSTRSGTSAAPGRGRVAQTRTWLVQQAGAWLQMHLLQAPAALRLCSSFPPSSASCCCLQTCQQISLCMCFLARSRHHQPGSLQPLLPLPQLCRPASHGVKGVKLPPWLGGRQLLGRKWWPAAGDGTSFRRSRQTFWAVRVP